MEDEEGGHCEADQRRGFRVRDRQEGRHGFPDHTQHVHFSRFVGSLIFPRFPEFAFLRRQIGS